ncbi:MAG TPA: DNA translocase FtsK [Dehalococcoidia bacterium]|nr:DNA translocase FtsK [Dehalococcoidia bacterium]
MARAKQAKSTAVGGPSRTRRNLFSRPVMLLLVLFIALALLFIFRSQVVSGFSTAWDAVFGALGYGVILVAVLVVLLLIFITWRQQVTAFLQRGNRSLRAIASSLALHRWNRWLGAIAFCVAIFGLLAFFDLGGGFGRAVIGTPNAIGALRLAGIVIVGIFLVAPRGSWRMSVRFFRALADSYHRYPLHRYLWRLACWPRAFYRRHPLKRTRISPPQRPARPAAAPVAGVGYGAPRAVEPKATPSVAGEPEKDRIAEAVPSTAGAAGEKIETVERVAEAGGRWQFPSLSLLERAPEAEPVQVDTERGTRIIEEALASYGVEARVVQVNVGPAVTQYGVEPGWDRKFKQIKEKDRDGNISVRLEEVSKTRVKVERIASLANDLALALSAPSIKIEAPVPGKAMVGIEVPNSIAGVVGLRAIIESAPFQKLRSKTKLPLALGKGVSGESVVADLVKMPHLLIAGATGSGKSVCITSVIITILLFASPDEVRLILVDPKRVELVSFSNVPHLITPVIVDREKAVTALKWLNREMDHRYEMMAAVNAKDITAYNKSPRVERPFPHMLLVIDELADLMATALEEVERMLCRLAQLSRATGIHLIVATQRPSVDVVTGLIKANFPARISFAVVSQVDSRTVLDTGGAEKLLGRGDMLFLPPDAPKPKRLQGSFVTEAEVERLVSFWVSQQPQEAYVSQLVQEVGQESADVSHEDPLLEKAKRLTMEHRSISTSFLQRRLGIGYPRAARIMDILEQQGVVAPGEPGKSRKVQGE